VCTIVNVLENIYRYRYRYGIPVLEPFHTNYVVLKFVQWIRTILIKILSYSDILFSLTSNYIYK
jgi:hypothetical protein